MRLLVLVLALGFTASAVLELRHRRLDVLHAMAGLHLQMDRHRRAAWDLQHRVSEATSPAALKLAVVEANANAKPDTSFEPTDAAASAESADRKAKDQKEPAVRGFEAIPQPPAGDAR